MKRGLSTLPRALALALAFATTPLACGGTKWDPSAAAAGTTGTSTASSGSGTSAGSSASSTASTTSGTSSGASGGLTGSTTAACPVVEAGVGTGPEAGVEGGDGGLTTYDPDNPLIQYSGRIDWTNPKKPRFAASAVYVTAKFRGTSVSIRFNDQGSPNIFEAVVDDMPAVKITPAPAVHNYEVPVTLCEGEHKVTFIKRTEADFGTAELWGIKVRELLPPDAKPTRKIEIIGDSITCGSGVEVTDKNAVECKQNGLLNSDGSPQSGYGQGVENGYLAYGPVLARTLGAEWHVTCASGVGLVRNYFSRTDQRPMPQIYDLMYPEEGVPNMPNMTKWDAVRNPSEPAFVPDVIVIGLGTNDFSRDDVGTGMRAAMDVATLEQGYIGFINQLAARYPGVHVFLAVSPLLGNGYPTSADMLLNDHKSAIDQVVAYYAADGGATPAGASGDGGVDVHVYAAANIPKAVASGCGGHPNVQDQADAANAIASKIKSAMGW